MRIQEGVEHGIFWGDGQIHGVATCTVGFLRGGVQGQGVPENPEDSGREDWGTLGKIGESPPPLKNPIIAC